LAPCSTIANPHNLIEIKVFFFGKCSSIAEASTFRLVT
jgi:hypothetical protein